MRFPEDGRVTIRSIADSRNQNISEFHGLIHKVSILGEEHAPLTWKKDTIGLHIETKGIDTKMPVVIQIQIK